MSCHSLILGGAKSGKSSFALALAREHSGPRLFLATATAGDQEMQERIARHRSERGTAWDTLEEPLALEESLKTSAGADRLVLVDCLTVWLSNLMTGARLEPAQVEERCLNLARLVPDLPGRIIFVANEVGMGIVPPNPLARSYRDAAGSLNQLMAAACAQVVLVIAGLPRYLKNPA